MLRRLRWAFLALVIIVVAAVAVAFLVIQPGLADARDRADRRWLPLRTALDARYTALATVDSALKAAGGADRPVTAELDTVLARWKQLAARGDSRADVGGEATTANELEALARRARANLNASPRLQGNKDLVAAFTAFDLAVAPPPAVGAYNRAARAYRRERDGTIHRTVASVLGFEERPELLLGQ